MAKLVDRFILRLIVSGTSQGFVWFGGLLLTATIITAMHKLVVSALPVWSLISLVGCEVPRVVLFCLPMAALYGAVQAFAGLSEHGELTALSAGGVSFPRLLWGPLAWGAGLVFFAYFVQETAVPLMQRQEDTGLAKALLSNGMVQLEFRYEDPPAGHGPLQRVLQAKTFDPANGLLTAPRIQIFDRDQRVKLEIAADRARWDMTTGKWQLFHGVTTAYSKDEQYGAHVDTRFESGEFDAPAPPLLSNATTSLQRHLDHADYEVVSIAQLWRYRERVWRNLQATPSVGAQRTLRTTLASTTYGIHDKVATPWLCLVVILVGAPLGIRPHRVSSSFAMGQSIVILLVYYGLWTGSQMLGTSAKANPVLMGYLSLVVLSVLGGLLVWKKSR